MAFEAFEVALQMVGSLREPLAALEMRDPSLAVQVRRSAASVALNLMEGGVARERTASTCGGSPPEAPTRSWPASAWPRRSDTSAKRMSRLR
jgi:hypothetical protein